MSFLVSACRCCFVVQGPASVGLKTPLVTDRSFSDSPAFTPEGSPALSARVASVAEAVLMPRLEFSQPAAASSSAHSAAMSCLDQTYALAQETPGISPSKLNRDDEEEEGWLLDLEKQGSFCSSTKPGSSRSSTPSATERLKIWFMDDLVEGNEVPVAGPMAHMGKKTGLRRMESSSSAVAAAGRGPLPYDEDPTEPASDFYLDDLSADIGWGSSEELPADPLPSSVTAQERRAPKPRELEDFHGTKVKFADQVNFAPDGIDRPSHSYEEKLLRSIGEYFHKHTSCLSCDHIVSLFAGTHSFTTQRVRDCTGKGYGSALLTREALRRFWRWEEGQILVRCEMAKEKFLHFLQKMIERWQWGSEAAALDGRVPYEELELFPEDTVLNAKHLCRKLGLDSNFQAVFENYWIAMDQKISPPSLNSTSASPPRSILRLSKMEKIKVIKISSQETHSPLEQKIIHAWRKRDWANTRAFLTQHQLAGVGEEDNARVAKILCQAIYSTTDRKIILAYEEGDWTEVKALLAVKQKEEQTRKEIDEERRRSFLEFEKGATRYKGR